MWKCVDDKGLCERPLRFVALGPMGVFIALVVVGSNTKWNNSKLIHKLLCAILFDFVHSYIW
jgi:hypothetical protein